MTMTEQTEQYDPANDDVAGVNAHLAKADVTERQRVIQAERDGKARKGVLEGPEASVPQASARAAQQDTERSQGFLGDRGETPEGTEPVKPAAEAAPDGVSTDPADAVVVPNGSPTLDLGTVPTVTDTPTPELTGEAYRRGYFGDVHTDENDNRPDLTLQGVLSQNQEK